jgi:type IV pilus assembly protein PilB
VIEAAKFSAVLQEKGILSAAECRSLLTTYSNDSFAALLNLVRSDSSLREDLGVLWGNLLGVAYVDPAKTLVQYDLCSRMPEPFLRAKRVLPLYELGGAVTVAVPNPDDKALRSEMENLLNGFVSPVFAFPDQIEAALEVGLQTTTGIERLLDKNLKRMKEEFGPVTAETLRDLSGDEGMLAFTRGLLLLALKRRASDIHIEPRKKNASIRFRIDGVLQEAFTLSTQLLNPIVSRYKILANLDIANSRLPQDGRIALALADRTVDVRFSSLPTAHGEKIVLRILGATQFASTPGLGELDFSQSISDDIERVSASPHGIFLVTGPTGSGKSTSLCALLAHLNRPGVNIMTAEDPIEYMVDGVNQTQVHDDIGLGFAEALRAFLRQDPDIIFVGEIRDAETASIAARAALTGHLVLSTLHTNSALQSITRLLDLGVDPTLLSPAMLGVMAQRLVRRLCTDCKAAHPLPAEQLDTFFTWDGVSHPEAFRAVGCKACNQTGFQGRMGVHELILMNDELRALIARAAPLGEMRAVAAAAGFKPLLYDGFKKALMGLTSFEEILRVCAGT